nr:PREDICTED: MICAL-like protein 2 [Bos mutus]
MDGTQPVLQPRTAGEGRPGRHAHFPAPPSFVPADSLLATLPQAQSTSVLLGGLTSGTSYLGGVLCGAARSPRPGLELALGFSPFWSDLCALATPGRAWGPCTLAAKRTAGYLAGTCEPQRPGLWGLNPALVLSSCCVALGISLPGGALPEREPGRANRSAAQGLLPATPNGQDRVQPPQGERNFDALRKENVYENNKLAFSVAEEQLGIPALLDAEDMVALKVPDRLSILTYVSQYYNYFQRGASAERTAGVKRPSSNASEEPSGKKAPTQPIQPAPGPARGQPLSPVSTNRTVQRKDGGTEGPPRKAGQAAGGSLNSSCGVCGQHVHLMQRHLADGRLYHRGCFRCKQCSSTLHSGAYRATGEPGVFICSSHHPETTSASPTLPSLASRRHGAMSMDSETPGGLRKTREASGQRDVGPKARLPGWDAVAGSTSARGSASAATDPPAPASSRVPTGSPAVPRLMVGPAGGEAGTHVTSSSLTVWPSPAGRPRPTGTPSAPDPCPATPQGWATPRVSAPQTKLSSRPASPVPASTPAWTPSSSKTQQARERFFQTPGAAPGPGPAAADMPSRDGRKEQALSFLRKTLPELGAPGRAAGWWVEVGLHARVLGLLDKRGPGSCNRRHCSFTELEAPGPSARGAVGAGAGSRLKLEAPLAKGKSPQCGRGAGRAVGVPGSWGPFWGAVTRWPSPTAPPPCGDGALAGSPSRGSLLTAQNWPRGLFSKGPDALDCPGLVLQASVTGTLLQDCALGFFLAPGLPLRAPVGPKAILPGAEEACRRSPHTRTESLERTPCLAAGEAGRDPPGTQHSGESFPGARLAVGAPEGPGASPQGSPEDQPAGWRARLKPVEKSPVDRAPEAKEPQVLREPRAGDAAGKASGSSKAGIRITLTSVRVDRTPGAAGPGASLPAASASASPLRKLAVPASLDVSGDWLQLEPSRKESPARSQKEEEKGPPQGKPGRPPGPAGVAAPPAKSAASPVRLHPDDMPPEIQRQVQDIERQLDALDQRGPGRLGRPAPSPLLSVDDSEDALMVDWFRLVHEKQLLLRLESELMYKARDQRLEEQQLDLEGELRRLMAKPEGLKSPQDRRREQDLLDQYVHTVNSRSDIIDFLDEDRLR